MGRIILHPLLLQLRGHLALLDRADHFLAELLQVLLGLVQLTLVIEILLRLLSLLVRRKPAGLHGDVAPRCRDWNRVALLVDEPAGRCSLVGVGVPFCEAREHRLKPFEQVAIGDLQRASDDVEPGIECRPHHGGRLRLDLVLEISAVGHEPTSGQQVLVANGTAEVHPESAWDCTTGDHLAEVFAEDAGQPFAVVFTNILVVPTEPIDQCGKHGSEGEAHRAGEQGGSTQRTVQGLAGVLALLFRDFLVNEPFMHESDVVLHCEERESLELHEQRRCSPHEPVPTDQPRGVVVGVVELGVADNLLHIVQPCLRVGDTILGALGQPVRR